MHLVLRPFQEANIIWLAAPRGLTNFLSLIQALAHHTTPQVSITLPATLRGLHGEFGLIVEIRFGPAPPASDIAGGGDPRTVWQLVAYIDPWSITTFPADPWAAR